MEIKVNPNKVSKYFTLPTLKFNEQCKLYKEQDAQYAPSIEMHSKHFIFGIEVEVEGVPQARIDCAYRSYWNITADNSLRNNGVEFVSVPLRATQIEGALRQLNSNLPQTHEFTPRTSTHVHMNVRDLTLTQITSLVILYTAMENVLFDWVGHGRDNNVFCTKLIDTNYVQAYIQMNNNPTDVVRSWNKYTALNLEPMTTKGTVEFRHLHGTMDIKRICEWINILSCMKTYALNTPLPQVIAQIEDLNSSSSYEAFVYQVFEQYGRNLITQNTASLMASAITYIKLATIFNEPHNVTPVQIPTDHDWVATPPTIALRFRTRDIPTTVDNTTRVDPNIGTTGRQDDRLFRLNQNQPTDADYMRAFHELVHNQAQQPEVDF
jgi:hypothetical protein